MPFDERDYLTVLTSAVQHSPSAALPRACRLLRAAIREIEGLADAASACHALSDIHDKLAKPLVPQQTLH